MITLLSALFASICTVGNSFFTKLASGKNGSANIMKFNAVKSFAALIFFLPFFMGKGFHIPTVLYACAYGFLSFFSTTFGFLALMSGSMAITSLIVSYSVLIPCLFGFIFLNEPMTVLRIAGILLLSISMYLLKANKQSVPTKKNWLLYVTITFFCNGLCSVIQKLHQIAFPSQYCTEFIFFSVCLNFILFGGISLFKKGKLSSSVTTYATIAGVFTTLANFTTLFLSAKVNATILFPIVCVFTTLFNVVISKFLFKDKFSILQLAGIVLGIVSVIFIK